MKYVLTSQTEIDILNLLWEKKQWMSGADFWQYFNSHGKPCKRQPVITYLTRMEEKGLLVKNGKKYMYAYTPEEFEYKKAKELLDTMYDGSLKNLVAALTGSNKINRKEADELREYLDQIDQ